MIDFSLAYAIYIIVLGLIGMVVLKHICLSEKIKNKPKALKIAGITALVLLISGCITFGLLQRHSSETKYQLVKEYSSNGEYDRAIEEISKIAYSYKDCEELKIYFQNKLEIESAKELLNNGEYLEAAKIFAKHIEIDESCEKYFLECCIALGKN